MADTIDHDHGSTGDKPPSGLNFDSGEFPNPEIFDWFWNQTVTTVNNHAAQLDAIDSDGDGKVDRANVADSADTVKGNDIDSDGDGKVDAADQADKAIENGVPSGTITMWSGSLGSVPQGWTLCDGTDGTPDLRDRFITGAGGRYGLNETGGSATVQLTEDEMPSHDHNDGTLSTSTDGDHTHDYNTYTSGGPSDYNSENGPQDPTTNSTTTDGAHSHNVNGTTGSAGSDTPHENRPPYHALAFIMKL